MFCLLQLSKIVTPYPVLRSILILDNHYTHESIQIISWATTMKIILLFEPAHDPNVNLTEWVFNAIKMKEKGKRIHGDSSAAVRSLSQSIFECTGCNWKKVLNKIGYIDNGQCN